MPMGTGSGPGCATRIPIRACFSRAQMNAVFPARRGPATARPLTPKPGRGFHAACADLEPERRFVVYAGDETYTVAEQTTAIPLEALARLIGEADATPSAG